MDVRRSYLEVLSHVYQSCRASVVPSLSDRKIFPRRRPQISDGQKWSPAHHPPRHGSEKHKSQSPPSKITPHSSFPATLPITIHHNLAAQ